MNKMMKLLRDLTNNLFAVYDVSRAETFESLNMWLEEVEQFACSGGRG
jgi:hypothetical protein